MLAVIGPENQAVLSTMLTHWILAVKLAPAADELTDPPTGKKLSASRTWKLASLS